MLFIISNISTGRIITTQAITEPLNMRLSVKVSKLVSKQSAQRPQKTTRLVRDGEMGEGGTEVGEEGDYIPLAPLVTTRLTPALRWAAVRAILMFQ